MKISMLMLIIFALTAYSHLAQAKLQSAPRK